MPGFQLHSWTPLLQVELLEFFFGELGDPGEGHEAVLVLGRDELDVFEVRGLLFLALLRPFKAEAEAHLENWQVVQRDHSRGHRDHDRDRLVPLVVHFVQGGSQRSTHGRGRHPEGNS